MNRNKNAFDPSGFEAICTILFAIAVVAFAIAAIA